MAKDIREKLTEKYNSLPEKERKEHAGLGYVLAQLTAISHIRAFNRSTYKAQDKKLANWQKNIEQGAAKEYLDDNQD